MEATDWPISELASLHRMFLDLRSSNAPPVDRGNLAFRLILCPASMARLHKACAGVCASHTGLANWQEDVLHESQLRLASWLSADSLNYVDTGIDAFGSWYWTLCRRACRRAASALRDIPSRSMFYIDPDRLTQCADGRQVEEHPFDRLSRAIARLPEGPQRNVILDWKSGLTVAESASLRGIPPRTLNWLRHRGRRLLLELCATDAAEGD